MQATPHAPKSNLCGRRERLFLHGATDEVLLRGARNGHDAAFVELYERHKQDAHRYARRLTHRHLGSDAADDIVAEAVRKVLTALRHGRGPRIGFRQYLFTAIRTVAYTARINTISEPRNNHPIDNDIPAADDHLDGIVAMSAFTSLPQRWQQVLWATKVEDFTPVEVAARVGSHPNSVAALALRARDALRIAYARAHLPRPPSSSCDEALNLIARRTVTSLTVGQHARLDDHFTACPRCNLAALTVEREATSWHWATHDDQTASSANTITRRSGRDIGNPAGTTPM